MNNEVNEKIENKRKIKRGLIIAALALLAVLIVCSIVSCGISAYKREQSGCEDSWLSEKDFFSSKKDLEIVVKKCLEIRDEALKMGATEDIGINVSPNFEDDNWKVRYATEDGKNQYTYFTATEAEQKAVEHIKELFYMKGYFEYGIDSFDVFQGLVIFERNGGEFRGHYALVYSENCSTPQYFDTVDRVTLHWFHTAVDKRKY